MNREGDMERLDRIVDAAVGSVVVNAVRSGTDYNRVEELLIQSYGLTAKEASRAWRYHSMAYNVDTKQPRTGWVYKVISRWRRRGWSLLNIPGVTVEYPVGEMITPPAGKLTAFMDLYDALECARSRSRSGERVHVYRCRAGLSSEELHERIRLLPCPWELRRFPGDRRVFINALFAFDALELGRLIGDPHLDVDRVPGSTVFCDWLHLIERVDV